MSCEPASESCPYCAGTTPRWMRLEIVDTDVYASDNYGGVHFFEFAEVIPGVIDPPTITLGVCLWRPMNEPLFGAGTSIGLDQYGGLGVQINHLYDYVIDGMYIPDVTLTCGETLPEEFGYQARLTFVLTVGVGPDAEEEPPDPQPELIMYCTRTDIENLFGVRNVAIWSNLDSTATGADESRITAAIAHATAWINDRFRGGRFTIPLANSASATPDAIRDLAARLAGVWLYESRGVDEQDEEGRPINRLGFHRRYVERQVLRYIMGRDSLDAVRTITAAGADAYPEVVKTTETP